MLDHEVGDGGYYTGRITFFDDFSDEEIVQAQAAEAEASAGSSPPTQAALLVALANERRALVEHLTECIEPLLRERRRRERAGSHAGDDAANNSDDGDDLPDLRMPRDPAELAWWIPTRLFELPSQLQYRLLCSRNVNERLQMLVSIVNVVAAQARSAGACAVQ